AVVDALTLRDAKRNKDLTLKIYHPKAEGPFPVVVFSHGFGGDKEAFADLSRHWASHGYVCLHPTHADSLRGKGVGLAGLKVAMDKGLSDPVKIAERVGDVTFLLDALPEIEAKVPALKGRLDAKRIAVAGHSFGAFTAMLVGGVTVDVP